MMLALVLLIIPIRAEAAALGQGSVGEDVKKLQSRLKQWDYYDGPVDGVFGNSTRRAVEKFQRKNGLTVDGVVGSATAKAIGISLGGSSGSSGASGGSSGSSSNKNLYLLAQLVHGEARGEPYKGMVAVAAVVLNRVESSSFPNSVSGVIYQKGAFSVVDDGQINLSPNEQSIKAARDAMNGWDPTGGCLYYYAPSKTTNKWMLSHSVKVRIGDHAFF
ncbi:MAG: spore cortex-lytic enzyme [Clostridia bacterium]|nr:spore cortex-lytic enzyme [Clostridia bacterium]MBQ6703629.1 spore cortex-lytic enzyme [Clostridia bacterium]